MATMWGCQIYYWLNQRGWKQLVEGQSQGVRFGDPYLIDQESNKPLPL